MAEKTVTVRLRALVDDYKRSMREAGKATGDVATQADKWKNLGQSTAALGDRMTRNVTLPLIAVGVAAAKMSTDFDNAFVRMQSLAGAGADEIDGMKEAVLGLAGETGKAPQELAEALYTLRSSGLDAGGAMTALEASAKASAAGLGGTEVIADAVSSAMLAYADAGMTAAQATDVLVATAKAGKAEPAELASQMGRLLPVSSQLGITFEEVGGSLAGLSLAGNDAAASSTLLANVMLKLLKPSQQAVEQLEGIGLSLEDLHDMIGEQGLIATLNMLRDRLGDAGFNKFMEDQQAVVGALALTNDAAGQVTQALDDVGNSAGEADAAFSTWAESMGAKNARAWAQLQTALIQLGDAIAPIAANVAQAVGTVAEAFGNLPSGMQEAIVYLGLFVAALGPILSVGGRVVSAVSAIYTGLLNLSVPAGTVSGAFNGATASTGRLSGAFGGLGKAAGVAAGAAGLGAVLVAIDQYGKAKTAERVDELTEAFLANKVAAEDMAAAFEGDSFAAADLSAVFDQLVDTNIEGARRFVETAEAAGASAEQIDHMRAQLEQKAAADRQSAADAEVNSAAIEETGDAAEMATSALQDFADALQAQFDPLFGMIDAQTGLRDSQVALAEAQAALNEAMAGGDASKIAEAQRAYDDALQGSASSLVGAQAAQAALNDAVQRGDVSLEDAKQSLWDWAINAGYTAEQAAAMTEKLDGATASAQWLDAQNVDVPLNATDHVTPTIASVEGARNRLDGTSATVTIFTRYLDALIPGRRGRPDGRALGGPVRAGSVYEVVEGGVPELLEQGGRTYLMPGQDGTVTPMGKLVQASQIGMGASGGTGRVDVGLHITGTGGLAKVIHEEVRGGNIQLTVNGQRVRAA